MSQFKYVKGAQEVQAALLAYPAKVEARVVRQALAAGARVVRDAERAAAPVRSGALRQTIRVSLKKRGKDVVASVKVGNLKKKVFYAHMVLGGTKAHTISVKQSKGLAIGGVGANLVTRKKVMHPGAKANDFVAKGRAAVPAAVDAIIPRARQLIDKLNREIGAA